MRHPALGTQQRRSLRKGKKSPNPNKNARSKAKTVDGGYTADTMNEYELEGDPSELKFMIYSFIQGIAFHE